MDNAKKNTILLSIYIILGIFLGMYIKVDKKFVEPLTIESLKKNNKKIRELREEIISLQKENSDFREKYEEFQELSRSDEDFMAFLERELTKYKMLLGLCDVKGPGIQIIMYEKESANRPKNSDVIHDSDLLNIINDLRIAGAEAITLNGQRVTDRTEIRCGGPIVRVNGVSKGSPFIIRAIGDKEKMYAGLTAPDSFAKIISTLNPIEVQVLKKDEILIKKNK